MAGSGTSSGGRWGEYVAVWKLALENVTLSPALTVTLFGKNRSSVAYFGVPAGGGVCSPSRTL